MTTLEFTEEINKYSFQTYIKRIKLEETERETYQQRLQEEKSDAVIFQGIQKKKGNLRNRCLSHLTFHTRHATPNDTDITALQPLKLTLALAPQMGITDDFTA